MADRTTSSEESRCLNCGFEAPGGDERWIRLDVPGIGRLTQCPDCESTDVIAGR